MQVFGEYPHADWWADGDTPVRNNSRVTYLIDGRIVLLKLCRALLTARYYIYLANWGLTATMKLVRGTDHQAGPAGSTEQEALLAELRADGLQDEDLLFWQNNELTMKTVLAYAVSKGVEVKVLLWKSPEIFSHYSPQTAYHHLREAGATCILDSSARGILHHPIESLHQKISIMDGHLAFVGGIDPLIEKAGEFDRWDSPQHPFSTPLRRTDEDTTPYPWHDAHARIEGPAAADVEMNFRQRWNDVVTHHFMDHSLLIPERPLPDARQSKTLTQITRTIPEHTYSFKPLIIRSIAQSQLKAFNNIQRYIYLENQYLWLRVYVGIDMPFLSTGMSEEMEQNIKALGAALRRGAALSLILPDHPNVGRAFSDEGLRRLRDEAPQAEEEGRLQVFCLATSLQQGNQIHYRPIYVHAKVTIVDDIWTSVGSANLNNRGMRDDTEMNVSTLDSELALGLRMMLQGEHLGLVSEDDLSLYSDLLGHPPLSPARRAKAQQIQRYLEDILRDPIKALQLMHQRAWDNLRLYQANQPLIGHLLPYLLAEEAERQGLQVRGDHGWIEEIPS